VIHFSCLPKPPQVHSLVVMASKGEEGTSSTESRDSNERSHGVASVKPERQVQDFNSSTPSLDSADKEMVDTQTGIEAAEAGIDLMNSNKFTEAEEMLKPWIHRSMYHSLANSTILFLQAVFSMEQDAIEKALQALNGAVALCNSQRKTQGVVEMVSSWVFGSRMETYTPAEVQAEVLFAESNLLLSIITFLQVGGNSRIHDSQDAP
jgi:hypothetical protein